MQYSHNVAILHRLVQSLGGSRDNQELRTQHKCQSQVVTDLSQEIRRELAAQSQQMELMSRHQATKLRATNAKLRKDYDRVETIATQLKEEGRRRMDVVDKQRADQALREAEAEKHFLQGGGGLELDEPSPLSNGHGKTAGLQQMQVQVQGEEEVNAAIIQETEAELKNINTSLRQVNEIYKDLASIVAQQQDTVDQIENNTEAAHDRAQEGLRQVEKAAHYQSGCAVS
ncbi:unnamed protein product [Chrysoparadoxa australica]